MATTGNFPTSHTTTTTTTRVVIAPCRMDCSYSSTIPGILKIVQIVLGVLGFICIAASFTTKFTGWFIFVAVVGYIVTSVLLCFYVFHVIERLYMLPWLLLEFIYCSVWAFFYLIAACLIAANTYGSGAQIAGAFFGFLALGAYGTDAFFKFRGWRAGEIAQGEKHITTSTSGAPTAY